MITKVNAIAVTLKDASKKELQNLCKLLPKAATHIRIKAGTRAKYLAVSKELADYLEGVDGEVVPGTATLREGSNRIANFEELSWKEEGAAPSQKAQKDVVKRAKSEIKNPCQRVWEICDQNKGAKRKDVLALCYAEGIAFHTARSQYQFWRAAGKAGSN